MEKRTRCSSSLDHKTIFLYIRKQATKSGMGSGIEQRSVFQCGRRYNSMSCSNIFVFHQSVECLRSIVYVQSSLLKCFLLEFLWVLSFSTA